MSELEEGELVMAASGRAKTILDADYKKADIPKFVEELTHLSNSEKNKLLFLLREFESLFDGTLGSFDTNPLSLSLKKDAKAYHAKAYTVPQVYEIAFKKK